MNHSVLIDKLQNLTNHHATQQEIADILGTSINTIGGRARRNSKYSFDEIKKIGEAYNVDLLQGCTNSTILDDWIKENMNEEKREELKKQWLSTLKEELVNSYMDNKAYLKTVNLEPLTASCGGGVVVSSNLIYDYDEKSTYSIVKVVGNSMETTLSDGSICIVKNYNGEQIKDNAIYFFSYGDESYIKRLAKNINEIVIMSDNKRYSDIVLKGDELDKIKIYGEVVKNMRDF